MDRFGAEEDSDEETFLSVVVLVLVSECHAGKVGAIDDNQVEAESPFLSGKWKRGPQKRQSYAKPELPHFSPSDQWDWEH